MSDVATLIAQRFIQRRDVKAKQLSNGTYTPDNEYNPATGGFDGPRIPWKMPHLHAHLASTATYGHYLLDQDSNCKLFAFDIDLEKTGFLPTATWVSGMDDPLKVEFQAANPREAWRDRRHPGRPWMKYQLRVIAERLAAVANKEMDLPVAIAYSGAKGLHVYCFTGAIRASDAREGAQLVLDTLGEFDLIKGQHFYRHKNQDPYQGYPNLSVEVYPKQGSLDGKDLGNLMRLPLGRNQKTTDPTFFVDLRAPLNELIPRNSEWSLTTDNPWNN
jgi:hypothetical protein